MNGPKKRDFMHPAMNEVFCKIVHEEHCNGKERNDDCFVYIAKLSGANEVLCVKGVKYCCCNGDLCDEDRRDEKRNQAVDEEDFIISHS